jgi:hypothetical protein
LNTGFLNTKRRSIFMTANGKYASRTGAGGLYYNPAAKYFKSPGGTERATKYLKTMTIPSPIRPKFDRKERSNKEMKRGMYKPRKGGMAVHHVKRRAFMGEMFEGYKPARGRGRPRKAVSWNLPNPMGKGMRKTRKNVGVKRGPRKAKAMSWNLPNPMGKGMR